MKNILLTGGTGFIGSHTCISLLKKGYNVTIVDSLINSKRSTIDRLNLIKKKNSKALSGNLEFKFGDIKNREFLEKVFSDSEGFDGVIHFASLKAVGESVSLPIKYWENNVFGTINLLNVMDKFDCNNLIFSSSATIYGNKNSPCLNENSKLEPINPYGSTKVAIECFLNDIFNGAKEKWRIMNLRYFNPIGAHSSGLIGENPNGIPNNIFPLILKVASKQMNELMIYGKDWETKDGTGVRDYIHVMDVSEAHILSLEFLIKKQPQYLSLNLGTGFGTSVLELIKVFERVNNVNIPYSFRGRREGDIAITIADNSLMKKVLNWQPTRSIEEMCKDGWKWQKNKISSDF